MVQKNNLKNHEKEYLHLSKKSLVSSCLTIVLGYISYLWWKVLVRSWEFLNLTGFFKDSFVNEGIHQLMICPMIIIQGVLILAIILSFISMFKKIDWDEVIWGVIGGVIAGVIGGVIAGVIGGVIWGVIAGVIWGVIWGVIGGVIGGGSD